MRLVFSLHLCFLKNFFLHRTLLRAREPAMWVMQFEKFYSESSTLHKLRWESSQALCVMLPCVSICLGWGLLRELANITSGCVITFESVDWVRKMALTSTVGIIQPTEGLNTKGRVRLNTLSSFSSWDLHPPLPSDTDAPCSLASHLDWGSHRGFPGSSACKWQIVRFLDLRNYCMSQFL